MNYLVNWQNLTAQDCEQNEFYEWLKALIEKQNISPFTKGKVTNVEIRIGEGKTNGKSISLSFKGMEPTEVKELILKNIDK